MKELATAGELCANCKFWKRVAQHVGQCKKNPPSAGVAMITNNEGTSVPQVLSFWPQTAEGDFCGEWSIDLRS